MKKHLRAIHAADQENARLRDIRAAAPDGMTASERAMSESAPPCKRSSAEKPDYDVLLRQRDTLLEACRRVIRARANRGSPKQSMLAAMAQVRAAVASVEKGA